MFGRGTADLFEQMPPLDGLDTGEAKRMLSTAYLDLLVVRAAAERRSGPERTSVIDYLRRLASAMESFAVFDTRTEDEVRSGAAFVAAEALALLIEMGNAASPERSNPTATDVASLVVQRNTLLVEAGLLYLVAGFETNAKTLIPKKLDPSSTTEIEGDELAFMDWMLEGLVALCRLDPGAARGDPPGDVRSILEVSLTSGVRAVLFKCIGEAVRMYLGWLAGGSDNGEQQARETLETVRHVLAANKANEHADIFHLCRITSAAIVATAPHAVRSVPPPNEEGASTYRAYLRSRAEGAARLGPRPVLWPAAQEYVQSCLPGPHSHAIVSVPTGAGKSFLAEIAVTQGMAAGWVLYLVPTNALANQVRRDLERALRDLQGAQVRAFLGGDEYTTLAEEHAAHVAVGTVVVMTPEKCALALRLAPEAFSNCRVCVFDECHLLSDGTRGVLAELVVSHIIVLASACRFVLMSAMMANPEDLKDWIELATGAPAIVVRKPWRPTRTMRGVVGADLLQVEQAAEASASELLQTPRSSRGRLRNRIPFFAAHVMVANLQGAWTQTSGEEYAIVRLPTATTLAVKLADRGRPELDRSGWVNNTSAVLTAFMATRQFSVLTFLPSNRHHCFSVAAKVSLPADLIAAKPANALVDALMAIADDELGVESVVGELLQRRLAVHTSALLDSEKAAAEVAFRDGVAVAMFATGTLAQGLNLPASVVVIGGTAVGDRREANTPEGRRRTRSQLLNALGRAGRAGFANHGLSLVVTDQPVFFQTPPDAQVVRQEASFLFEEDDSTVVDSRLQTFVEAGLGGRLEVETASSEELVALSYLPFEPIGDVTAEQILRRSYAVHRQSKARDDDAARVAAELVRVGREYVLRVEAPDWITTAAYKTGLPFLTCLRLYQALQRVTKDGRPRPSKVAEWKSLFFRVLAQLPPQRAREILRKEVKSDVLATLWDQTIQGDDPSWDPSKQWLAAWEALEKVVSLYVTGEQFALLARTLFAVGESAVINPGRSDGRKPIPRTIDFVNDILEHLSRVAGALVAIDESVTIAGESSERSVDSSRSLALLPLAIRYGCSSRDVLAWFRFGIRFRRAAHLFARLFPVPDDIVEDTEVQRWVRRRREAWLTETGDLIKTPQTRDEVVLHAARVVLTSS